MREPIESEHNIIKNNISNILKGETIRVYLGLFLSGILAAIIFYAAKFIVLNENTTNNPLTIYVGVGVLFSLLLVVFCLNIRKINKYKRILENKTYKVLDCVSQNIEVKYPDFIDNRTRLCASIKDKEKNKSISGSFEILNEIGSDNYHSFSIEFKNADCILVEVEEGLRFVLYNKII